MTVLAIEVELNGKRLSVAGAKDLALLSAQIAAGVGSENRTLQVDMDVFHLTAMGLTSPKSASRIANLTWINGLPLKLGDSITFRIVQVEQPDPPAQVLRTPTTGELAAAAEKERSGLTARSKTTRRRRRALKRGR
jgi:hypothetical protein